jgi:hypothetical protein
MMEFVDRVRQIKPAQQRIPRDLRRAKYVASAIGLHFSEGEQLAHAPVKVTPDPPVDYAE